MRSDDLDLDLRGLSRWLTDDRLRLPLVDHQDGEWVIASTFRHDQLLPLLQLPSLVPSRRDSLLFALMVQLKSLLNPSGSSEPYDEANSANALDVLTRFARDNWTEILRVHREMGLGVDFDNFVVAHVTGD